MRDPTCHDCNLSSSATGCLKHAMTITVTTPDISKPPLMMGWVCPVCGAGVSPYITLCPCKPNSLYPPLVVKGNNP